MNIGILLIKKDKWGLSWWLSAQESTCQRRRHEFDPWSGKCSVPQSSEAQGATAVEPVLQSLGSAAAEPTCCGYWSLCTLELVPCDKRSLHPTAREWSPLTATREKPHSSREPEINQ